jgi:hypothetical protein
MNLLKCILQKSWIENNTSENEYWSELLKIENNKWQIDHWKKDKVDKLIKIDGFHLKEDGRAGTIYYVEENKLCQIFFEISGVKQFDILIFFEQLKQWELPVKKNLSDNEIEEIKEKLLIWLQKKNIKSDL